jgi:hypothetical protein
MIVLACVLVTLMMLTIGVNADCVVRVTIRTDNAPTETSFELIDSSDVVHLAALQGSLTTSGSATLSATLPKDDYRFTIRDVAGDGICCAFGNGDYTLDIDGVYVVSPSGGAFGFSESVAFSCELFCLSLSLVLLTVFHNPIGTGINMHLY